MVDSSGNVIASAYVSMAAQMSKDAGIAYRYGPNAASYGVTSTGLPQLYQRTTTPLGAPAPAYPFYWQVGGPPSSTSGSYSTNQANMVFVADDPTKRVGVTDFQVSGYMFNTFAQSPQLSWTIAAAPGGGLDSLNVSFYKAAGTVSGDPIAVGRCAGRAGFCSQGVVAFQNGVIGTVGSNTAANKTTVQLAPNKVPTAIAMTNDSEFALVTVWDTVALKGQVAVIALAGLCDNCSPYLPNGGTAANGITYSGYYDWWHEWMAPYPGLPNMGNIAFMKVLGYVDLPGMAAPSEIAVTTGMDQFQTMAVGGNFIGYTTPLNVQTNRQSFLTGGSNAGKYAKGGVAVVISKSEQKVAFIDLKPLFSYVNNVYFGGDLATFTSTMGSLGQADSQWPYTFVQQPIQTPTVIKTVSLPAKPTAVKASVLGSPQRAWVATQDGTLHIFSLDGYAPGPTVTSPTATAIAEVGSVTGIGRNPTSIATSKGEPDNSNIEPLNQQVLVASRGDLKVSWVRFASNGNSGSIVRTLQDARLVDPIGVEDSDNFANSGYVMSVTDYAGKAVRNFRYGPVVFSDGGACPAPTGCPVIPTTSGGTTYNIEYGGALDMSASGKPYQLNTANVP